MKEEMVDGALLVLAERLNLNVIGKNLDGLCRACGIPTIIVQGKKDPVIIAKIRGLIRATDEIDGIQMIPANDGRWKFCIDHIE